MKDRIRRVARANGPILQKRGWNEWIGRVLIGLSLMLCVLSIALYQTRADWCAAITVFPSWVWALPGLVLVWLGGMSAGRRSALIATLVWLLALLALADHPMAIVRRPIVGARSEHAGSQLSGSVRAVTINCSTGNARAADEAAFFEPEVVLLQESPSRDQLLSLARKWYGDEGAVLWGRDASIIARGDIQPLTTDPAITAIAACALVRLTSGIELKVVSLRLVPAQVRGDLWSPECWKQQTANRRRRRSQLIKILQAVPQSRAPMIVGGDFNAPSGDAVFEVLRPGMRDAFAESGRGWGNTITNDWPFHRIDQIWLGGDIRADQTFSARTKHSDHRLVVCDLIVR